MSASGNSVHQRNRVSTTHPAAGAARRDVDRFQLRARPRRVLVGDRHQAEGVGGVRRPVVVGAKADLQRLVLALVVVAERVAAGFGGRPVEQTLGKIRRTASILMAAAPLPWFGTTTTSKPASRR